MPRWEVHDADFYAMSLEEIKAYALEIAGLENDLRAFAIKVQSEVIRKIHASWPVLPYDEEPKTYKKPVPRRKTDISDNLEDLYSIGDFK